MEALIGVFFPFFVIFIAIAVGGIVLSQRMGKKKLDSISSSMDKLRGNPKVNAIGDYIVGESSGRPAEIIFLDDNQIYFGPVNGTYRNVPMDMIPRTDYEQRRGLAGLIAEGLGYHWSVSALGQSAIAPSTGIPAIDEHYDCYLRATNTGSWD